jgi:hypothetical protein
MEWLWSFWGKPQPKEYYFEPPPVFRPMKIYKRNENGGIDEKVICGDDFLLDASSCIDMKNKLLNMIIKKFDFDVSRLC